MDGVGRGPSWLDATGLGSILEFTVHISNRTELALGALVLLGRQAPGGRLRLQDIASKIEVPVKVLESLLADLRRAGLVDSRRGPDGGHLLARPMAAIRVLEVVEAADGPLHVLESAVAQADEGRIAARLFRNEWLQSLRLQLERTSLEDVSIRADSGSGKVDFSI